MIETKHSFMISECCKLAKREYRTRHDWVWKIIHWEWCKKFEFDHTNKWYMHNPESILENETNKIPWDFEIQTDHLFSARRPDLMIVEKKKERICWKGNFTVPGDHWVKLKESENRDKYLDLARELKKLRNIKVTVISIVIDTLGTVAKGLIQGLEDLEIRRREETNQTPALFRSTKILRRALDTWRDLLSIKLQWETINDNNYDCHYYKIG